mmetsp:Transcript_21961/g.70733  ORF Transcript_21961/g.70733 Transcript_21961/m.70733 type:complete len:183 (+) Transcript_21961:2685-3233(+)
MCSPLYLLHRSVSPLPSPTLSPPARPPPPPGAFQSHTSPPTRTSSFDFDTRTLEQSTTNVRKVKKVASRCVHYHVPLLHAVRRIRIAQHEEATTEPGFRLCRYSSGGERPPDLLRHNVKAAAQHAAQKKGSHPRILAVVPGQRSYGSRLHTLRKEEKKKARSSEEVFFAAGGRRRMGVWFDV